MFTRVRVLSLALITLLSIEASAKTTSALKQSDTSAIVRIPGHVLSALATAERVASEENSAARQPLTLTIVLKHDDQRGFDRYLSDLYNSHSSSYHHFLTQRQIADRFGPSRAVYNRTLHYLESDGFRLVEGSANHLTITVRGSRALAERIFRVHIGRYRARGKTFFANDSEPAMPAELAAHVLDVTGLSNLAIAQPSEQAVPFNFSSDLCVENSISKFENIGARTPRQAALDYAQVYRKCSAATKDALVYGDNSQSLDPPPPAWLGVDGTGQTIGLVEFDTFQPSDVSDYANLIGIGNISNLSEVHVGGGATAGPNESEVLIDIDNVMSVAPGAKIITYDGPFGERAAFNKFSSECSATGR